MKLYTWEEIEAAPGVCRELTRKYREALGGKGLTLAQAGRAALAGKLPLPDLVRAAVGLKIRGWQKRLGRMLALAHLLAKGYYKTPAGYQYNRRALEEGRLRDIDRAFATYAAEVAAADATYAADAAYTAAKAAAVAHTAVAVYTVAAAKAAVAANAAAYADAAYVDAAAAYAGIDKADLIRAFCGPLKPVLPGAEVDRG